MDLPGWFTHAAAALGFGGFALLALLVAWRGRHPSERATRRPASLLIAWALVVSCGAGFLQRDLYPFSHWQLLANPIAPVWHYPLLLGVDAAGREHRLDYRAVDPFSFAELMAFLDRPFQALEAPRRDTVAAHLLALAQAARERVLAGRDIRPSGRWFGPLRAPYFDLSPARWRTAADVPPPFVRLRLYQQVWEIERRRGPLDTLAVSRSLIYEGPTP